MNSGKKAQCILVKSDEFENSYSLLYILLNPVYAAARSLRSFRSKYAFQCPLIVISNPPKLGLQEIIVG